MVLKKLRKLNCQSLGRRANFIQFLAMFTLGNYACSDENVIVPN